jgi:hypothetical protein
LFPENETAVFERRKMPSLLSLALAQWKPIAALLALAGLLFGYIYVRGLWMENESLEAAHRNDVAAIESLKANLAEQLKAVGARQAESDRLAKERAQARKETEKAYETDEESCDWSRAPIPPAVAAVLCRP